MFWGLILKANKKYTQILEKPFHLSHAALDHSSSSDEPIQVMYNHEDASYLLCTLQKGSVMQCALDLNFAEGDKLCFTTKGNGIVHLTGFLVPEDDLNYGEFDSEEEGSETEVPDLREKLSKAVKDKKSVKNDDDQKSDEDDSDDSADEEDLSANDEDDESGEEDEDDDDDDESEEDIVPPKAKQAKLDPQQIKDKKQQNGMTNGQEKKKNQQEKQQQQQQPKTGQMQKMQGGLMYQDLKIGNGAEAKVGKKIQVYYEGRLKDNNKLFDSTKGGSGFKVILGRGEVIKGWDIGLQGMKVGGKRRLICPPALAYGKTGNRPAIPPNATLIFDVELKNVL